nr:MAG TPA: hypothetical protein [Caudoviricetes sp.]
MVFLVLINSNQTIYFINTKIYYDIISFIMYNIFI